MAVNLCQCYTVNLLLQVNFSRHKNAARKIATCLFTFPKKWWTAWMRTSNFLYQKNCLSPSPQCRAIICGVTVFVFCNRHCTKTRTFETSVGSHNYVFNSKMKLVERNYYEIIIMNPFGHIWTMSHGWLNTSPLWQSKDCRMKKNASEI